MWLLQSNHSLLTFAGLGMQPSPSHRSDKDTMTEVHQRPTVGQYSQGNVIKCLLIPDLKKNKQNKKTVTDQSKVTTIVQLGDPVGFIGIAYRRMGEGLLTAVKMPQR